MTEHETELARRAVAAKGWRWLPGMLDSKGLRILRVAPDGYAFAWNQTYHHGWTIGSEGLPDLGDAATRGCVLELVRNAWQDRGLSCVTASYTHDRGYQFRIVGGHHHGSTFMGMSQRSYDSEPEALIAALEAAP